MRSFSGFIACISDFFAKVCLQVGAITMCLMTSLAFCSVVFRYIIKSPISWAEEVCRFLLIIFAFSCISYGLKKKKHIGITFLLDRLTGKSKKALMVADIILIMILNVFLCLSGIKLVIIGLPQVSPILSIPLWVVYLTIPISAVIMLIHLINELLELFLGHNVNTESNLNIAKKEGLDLG